MQSNEVICITIEDIDDGGGNSGDHFRPIPNIYTDRKIAAKVLYDLIKKDYEKSSDSCDSDSDSELSTSEPEVNRLLSPNQLFDKVLKKGGFKKEDEVIRVTILTINNPKLNYSSDWDLPFYSKIPDENKESKRLRKYRKHAEKKGIQYAEGQIQCSQRIKGKPPAPKKK